MDLSLPTTNSAFPIVDASLSAPAREHWSQVQLSRSKWFPKLEILIFGLALVFAVDLLYNFPLGPANPNGWHISDTNDLGGIAAAYFAYALLLPLMAVVLLTFTSMCLALRLKKLDLPSWVQEILWICLIVILVGGFFLFDWSMFNRPNATPLTLYGFPSGLPPNATDPQM